MFKRKPIGYIIHKNAAPCDVCVNNEKYDVLNVCPPHSTMMVTCYVILVNGKKYLMNQHSVKEFVFFDETLQQKINNAYVIKR